MMRRVNTRLAVALLAVLATAGAATTAAAADPKPDWAGPTVAEKPLRAENALQAQKPLRAENALQAQKPLRAENALQVQKPLRAENALLAEEPLRAEKKKKTASVPGSRAAAESRIRDCVNVGNSDVGRGDVLNYVAEVKCLIYHAIWETAFDYTFTTVVFDQTTHNEVVRFQQCANALGAGLVVDGRVGNKTRPHLEWWAAHSEYIC
jgi:zinc D-Ala-D-Ala carboxypeptidase